jgi:hypothetical protein
MTKCQAGQLNTTHTKKHREAGHKGVHQPRVARTLQLRGTVHDG